MNYRKYIPNSALRRLFGSSVLSENGEEWKRHRMLMNDIFSANRVDGFQDVFVAHTERLVSKWERRILQTNGDEPFDILPDLTAVSLDIIGAAGLGRDLGALEGRATGFLNAFEYALEQSKRPVHAFTRWWKHLPLPASRRLREAFRTIVEFLEGLIREARERAPVGQDRRRNLMGACWLRLAPPVTMRP